MLLMSRGMLFQIKLKTNTIHLIQKWPPLEKKLPRVARKRGRKGQFGWNKNKKVNQLTLQHNCHFSSLSNSFSSPQNMQNSTETTLGPYELIFVQLAPVFFRGHFRIMCIAQLIFKQR